jgi:hypothetical protein
VILADLDPEPHRRPLGIPAGLLGKGGWEVVRLAPILFTARSDEEHAPWGGRAGSMTNRRGAQSLRRGSHRMSRRELMLLLGGAMAVSRTLRAQQKAVPVIGYL